MEAAEACRVPGWEMEVLGESQALHAQMFLDVWTKTDEQRQCSEPIYSVLYSDPSPDSREAGRDCRE